MASPPRKCEGVGKPARKTVKAKVGRDADKMVAQCSACERWFRATDSGLVRWHKKD